MQHTIGVIMGSDNDMEIMKEAVTTLREFGLKAEVIVSSAHRTPERTIEWARTARERGLKAIIVGAGAAAHLAGVVSAKTTLPVVGVPIDATSLGGLDALLSTVQMPGGVPVASMAIGKAGAKNAGIYVAMIIGTFDPEVAAKLDAFKKDMADKVIEKSRRIEQEWNV
ncbi:5-(carboxyamino)imidazole ribonucleotide mutase [Desulfurispirillum indicum]|uniref:N5-carboxyaminoimidazole ribonucleotide mutase n=1 Tax=Desulfurispirillum indicum (strain ATCC BAA-1389 / DSM 22839 / S5) TaxID=653733 RepID=E6W0X2_DESIS|nr:5-(carboxyamino)imidazole ribonucleotide mutase [Desulfurispirillum indicum]ADU65304.1 phosphoribosylaminoimidazole carboxylase, catalytic subunit [Desulfurispirillum indicum S5]UCZ57201.1 5-(carboxyamino)imidazole ribonucleotide mutase [Desulfurispirillum indicum]